MTDHEAAYVTLRDLRDELRRLVEKDLELSDSAVRAIDAALDEARRVKPDDDVIGAVMDLVSPEAAMEGEARVWAADALVIVTTALARLGLPAGWDTVGIA